MKRALSVLLRYLLCAGVALSCFAAADGTDPLKTALRPEWFQLEADRRTPGDDRLVLLIGENHASVRGQIHLADLLAQLLDAKQIDAILVEGSEGPIDVHEFDAELTKLLPRDELVRYWRRQLEWGEIAGWEHVVLTRPETPAQGVEDMAAKTRFFITDLNGSDQEVQRQLGSWERGGGRLDAAITALEKAGLAQPKARAALDGYRKGLGEYADAARSFAGQRQPIVARQLEAYETAEELERLLVSTRLAELRGRKDAEKLFRQRLEQLVVEQPAQVSRLSELTQKYQTLERELEAMAGKLGPHAKALGKRIEETQDAFFTIANQARAAAETRWGPAAGAWPPDVRETLGSVSSFFRDEAVRLREEDRIGSRQPLAERDRAMVANTASYLRDRPVRRVALIVGAAHLDGMAEELTRLGIPFVRGRLLPAESEPWEEEAWERRRQPAEEVPTTGHYKERSRLLDAAWRRQQIERIEKLLRGAAPAASDSSGKKEESGVVRSPLLPDQRVPRGPQVLAWGTVPGSAGEVFEIWDRVRSRRFVEELSDGRVELVYGYLTAGANPQYTLVTPRGDRTLEAFRDTPPGDKGKRPAYVVAFYEPDFQERNGVPYSPLWKGLRNADGGGRKGPPNGPRRPGGPGDGMDDGNGRDGRDGKDGEDGKDDGGDRTGDDGNGGRKPPSWTAFGEPEPERPRLFRTTNPERARRNLDRLLEQKPLEASEVRFYADPLALPDAPYAERDGTNAGTVVLMADNTPEFRAALLAAAEGRKLVNKQVVLITCGHVFPETGALRELLLASGALMVWTPDRQIAPQIGERLLAQMRLTLQRMIEEGRAPRDMDELINRAIADLLRDNPADRELPVLRDSGTHVELVAADEDEEDRDA